MASEPKLLDKVNDKHLGVHTDVLPFEPGPQPVGYHILVKADPVHLSVFEDVVQLFFLVFQAQQVSADLSKRNVRFHDLVSVVLVDDLVNFLQQSQRTGYAIELAFFDLFEQPLQPFLVQGVELVEGLQDLCQEQFPQGLPFVKACEANLVADTNQLVGEEGLMNQLLVDHGNHFPPLFQVQFIDVVTVVNDAFQFLS